MNKSLILTILLSLSLTACGTLTGLPGHGGGKRFAVEQELVAASSRAAVKEMDLSALQGRKVALFVVRATSPAAVTPSTRSSAAAIRTIPTLPPNTATPATTPPPPIPFPA